MTAREFVKKESTYSGADPNCPNCDGTGGALPDGSCGMCWNWREMESTKQTKPLQMQQPLLPDQMRKLITVKRPEHNLVGCLLCLSGKELRVIESPGTGEILLICKPCLTELARRNVS